jgi:dicarboxylate/amino acid:cation (Na+ or H+) symporter, DAACS family
MKRPVKILIGLIIGTIIGIVAHMISGGEPWLETAITNIAQPIGQIFLRLILMIVVPLVFSSLLLGVFELGDFRSLGRVGIKTLLYTMIASVSSVVIGLSLVGLFKPGTGLPAEMTSKMTVKTTQSTALIAQAQGTKSLPEIIVSLIPRNPLGAAVNALEGDMVCLMIFALIFGAALVMVRPGATEDPFIKVMETIRDASMKVVDFAMAFAPYGVAALMFSLTARFGWGLLLNLGKYVGVVLLGLFIQQFVVYGLILKFYCKKNPWQFVLKIREVIVTAFSTASSNATLPTTIRVAEEIGIDRKIASFVLTIGSTANQNGTALFEGVTILFLAQVFHVDLSLGQQVVVLLMSVVAGIGTAGVPGGSIPLIVIVLQSVGIPPEGIGLILGVDRLLDMSRTVLNVTGDVVAAMVVDTSEKKAHAKTAALQHQQRKAALALNVDRLR